MPRTEEGTREESRCGPVDSGAMLSEKDEEGGLEKCPEVGTTVGLGRGQRAGPTMRISGARAGTGRQGVAGPTEAGANEHRALRCLQGGDEKDGRSDQPRGKASDGLLTPRR